MTEKQIEKMNVFIEKKYPLEAMSDFSKTMALQTACEFGYTAAHNDATAIIEKLEKSLEFYTDPVKYHWISKTTAKGNQYEKMEIRDDEGKTAREALAELNEWRES